MESEPYLETCCRAALHRLVLSGDAGRPAGLADEPCLRRLIGMDLCLQREDGRFDVTISGRQRHAVEILHCRLQPGHA